MKASTAANWKVGGVSATTKPATGDDILLDGSTTSNMTWDAGMEGVKPASWTQDGYTGTVTFETVSTAKGTFNCVEVTGNVTLNSGTWTHLGNLGLTASTYTKYNRLYVKCGGSFTLGAGATISANGLGYGDKVVVIYGLDWQTGVFSTQGGSYGGHGGFAVATKNFTYGCYYAPEDLGNAGSWHYTQTGAGAIRLDIAGAFVHNGTITADSLTDGANGHYSGAGGSIYVTAASIAGTGTMSASAGATLEPGAGGRIAIILTGKTGNKANGFDDYDVLKLVRAVPLYAVASQGGCGTIYCETADDTPHEGWMILKGNGTEPVDSTDYPQRRLNYADPFTYEYTNLHFARLTVTNNVYLRVGSGYTLNLKDTVLEMSGDDNKNGFALDGGAITFGGEDKTLDISTRLKVYQATTTPKMNITSDTILFAMAETAGLSSDVTLACPLTSSGTSSFGGDLTLLAGSSVNSSGSASSSGGATLNLAVAGDMSVASGVTISMDGKGYSVTASPQGTTPFYWAGSHGGYSLDTSGAESATFIPYDSITEPAMGGAGGCNGAYGTAGGGVIKLTVGGTLTLDGTITACSSYSQYYPGAGGAVNIRAGRLAGASTGVIRANAGISGNANSVGGGGRIAVRLTGEDADFSGYAGKITAWGTNGNGTKAGGAGTVWLKTAAQAETEGTLIVANDSEGTRGVGGSTPLAIDSYNSELSFGDVIIGPKSKLTLAADTILSVAGSFSNGCQFAAGSGSTVQFVGSADARVYDALGTGLTFAKLVCTVPDKEITFADDVSVVATELANFTGAKDDNVKVWAGDGGTWNFNGTGATLVFNDVAIGGCQSTTDLTVQGGEDLGDNSANVSVKIITPTTLTWTGTADDKWTTPENWSPASGEARVPLAVDTVVIPATARAPLLTAAATCAALTVDAGASLDLVLEELTVAGNLTVNGTVIARGTQTVKVGGDIAISGRFVRANSSLVLNAAEAQSVASVSRFFDIVVQAPSVTFSGPIVCDSFSSTASDERRILFANGASLSANYFTVKGADAETKTVLAPSVQDGEWMLTALVSEVDKVAATNCDASAGCPIYPTASVGDGNENWIFADTRTAWDGTTALTAGQDLLVGEKVTATISSAISLNSIELLGGASLTISAKVPVAQDFVVGTNATVVWNSPSTIGGNFVLRSGASLKHAANASEQVNRLDLDFGGNGLVELGSTVNANGCGYAAGYIPDGSLSATSAGSHGGQGWRLAALTDSNIAPYGSIVNPTTMGASSTYSAGGGAVRLSFGGWLTVDGAIAADGAVGSSDNKGYSGAGGSINLTAARLSGAGSIHASAGASSANNASAGGGRVAIALTDSTEDFSEFGSSAICAYGRDGSQVGGAGTVLLRKNAADADHGDLVIRNRGTATPNVTVVGGEVEGTSFRDVTIDMNAKLKLADNATMTVAGTWTNGAAFVAGEGSTVRFTGAETAVVYGDNTFVRLALRTDGKTVRFAAGSTQTVSELLTAEGGMSEGTYLTLAGVGDASWNLVATGARVVLTGVALGGCQSDVPITVVNGKNLGGNSDNVTFTTAEAGATIVWTGAADTAWENPSNWDLSRVPIATDNVQIPATAHAPALGADAAVASLSVASGASLDVSSRTLEVAGVASILGSVTGTSEARLIFGANATLGGTWSLVGATVDFLGTTARTLAVTTGSTLPKINVSGAVTLTGNCACEAFTAAAGSAVMFETGKKLSATKFTVSGTLASHVTLAAAGVWKLVAMESTVEYADVSNSDAGEGLMVVAPTSTDNGGNVNWLFEDTRVKWIGGASGDFNTAANWSGSAVPGEEDDVLIEDATVTLALVASKTNTVKSLALGADAKLVVNGNLETVGSVSLADGSTLEWNRYGKIGGNLVALSGATMTHKAGGSYRIDLDVAGNGLFSSGSKVNVKGLGYTISSYSGYNAGGSHGGRGYHGNSSSQACYDSIVAPILCGKPGGNGSHWSAGGGAVSLIFGGDLTFDGEIDADGADNNTYYSGAGGSIRFTARTLLGSGTLHADGGITTGQSKLGGGGRISIILSEGDFSGWAGTATCYGGWNKTSLNCTDGSAGTVFFQAAGEPGTLFIENRANTVRQADGDQKIQLGDATDFPSENRVAEVTGIDVVVGTYGTLYLLKDMTIRSLAVQGTEPRVRLEGHTLTVTKYTRRAAREAVEAVTTKAGGTIVWPRRGLAIFVK